MAVSLSAREVALLRGRIEGMPYPALARLYLDSQDPLEARHKVDTLRKRLARKAELVRRPDLLTCWLAEEGEHHERWQQQALKALEQLLALPEPVPDLDDPVVLWLPPKVAKTLIQAGFTTLRPIYATVLEQGCHWWVAIRGVGPGCGRAVLRLFASMGLAGSWEKKRVPVQTLAENVLQHLSVARSEWSELDGSRGSNRERSRRCRLDVQNDFQAIEAWLSLYAGNQGTCRQYRREAERFARWCVFQRNKAFSSADTQDCADYLAFIEAPEAGWLGAYGVVKSNDRWAPFRATSNGGLAPRSRKLARTVLHALCRWLVEQAYLEFNPFAGLTRPRLQQPSYARRALSLEQWYWLLEYGEEQIVGAVSELKRKKYRRVLFVLRFAYETGLRLSELVGAKVGDVVADVSTGGEPQWWLKVRGKGGKIREVPISEGLLVCISEQLAERAYPEIEKCDATVPLIGRVRLKRAEARSVSMSADLPLTASGLHYLLRDYFEEAAQTLVEREPKWAEQIAKATTHWLRHSCATHAVAAGLPLDVLRENLGHEDLATTSLYVRTARDRQYEETTKWHRVRDVMENR